MSVRSTQAWPWACPSLLGSRVGLAPHPPNSRARHSVWPLGKGSELGPASPKVSLQASQGHLCRPALSSRTRTSPGLRRQHRPAPALAKLLPAPPGWGLMQAGPRS